MKLWVDDIRTAPYGYHWCRSVNEAKKYILSTEKRIERYMDRGKDCFQNFDFAGRTKAYSAATKVDIEVIDIDHDAGDFARDGGDYINLLNWLEETGRNYPIRIHTMNPVGREQMKSIIERNGWTECS